MGLFPQEEHMRITHHTIMPFDFLFYDPNTAILSLLHTAGPRVLVNSRMKISMEDYERLRKHCTIILVTDNIEPEFLPFVDMILMDKNPIDQDRALLSANYLRDGSEEKALFDRLTSDQSDSYFGMRIDSSYQISVFRYELESIRNKDLTETKVEVFDLNSLRDKHNIAVCAAKVEDTTDLIDAISLAWAGPDYMRVEFVHDKIWIRTGKSLKVCPQTYTDRKHMLWNILALSTNDDDRRTVVVIDQLDEEQWNDMEHIIVPNEKHSVLFILIHRDGTPFPASMVGNMDYVFHYGTSTIKPIYGLVKAIPSFQHEVDPFCYVYDPIHSIGKGMFYPTSTARSLRKQYEIDTLPKEQSIVPKELREFVFTDYFPSGVVVCCDDPTDKHFAVQNIIDDCGAVDLPRFQLTFDKQGKLKLSIFHRERMTVRYRGECCPSVLESYIGKIEPNSRKKCKYVLIVDNVTKEGLDSTLLDVLNAHRYKSGLVIFTVRPIDALDDRIFVASHFGYFFHKPTSLCNLRDVHKKCTNISPANPLVDVLMAVSQNPYLFLVYNFSQDGRGRDIHTLHLNTQKKKQKESRTSLGEGERFEDKVQRKEDHVLKERKEQNTSENPKSGFELKPFDIEQMDDVHVVLVVAETESTGNQIAERINSKSDLHSCPEYHLTGLDKRTRNAEEYDLLMDQICRKIRARIDSIDRLEQHKYNWVLNVNDFDNTRWRSPHIRSWITNDARYDAGLIVLVATDQFRIPDDCLPHIDCIFHQTHDIWELCNLRSKLSEMDMQVQPEMYPYQVEGIAFQHDCLVYRAASPRVWETYCYDFPESDQSEESIWEENIDMGRVARELDDIKTRLDALVDTVKRTFPKK
jgi:hypothetical protein